MGNREREKIRPLSLTKLRIGGLVLFTIPLIISLSFCGIVYGNTNSGLQMQAFEYMKTKNYRMALECYSSALKEQPTNSWQIMVNIGNCYVGLGDYNRALSIFLNSIEEGGLHPTQCMNISAVYQKLGENKKSLSWLQAACMLDPIGEADPGIQATMRKLQDEQNYPSGSQSASDYLSSLISKRKWHKESMPFRVYVRKNIQMPEFYEEFKCIVKNSFNQWCLATDGAIPYIFVDTKETANVICDYTDHRELLDPDHELGIEASTQTRVRFDDNAIDWANMVVLVKDYPDSKTFRSRPFLIRTCLHEFGHIIGMHGHSPNSLDVMFPSATLNGRATLSERDKNTVRKIYRQ